MFKDSPEGQTHSFGDGCIPPHILPTVNANTNPEQRCGICDGKGRVATKGAGDPTGSGTKPCPSCSSPKGEAGYCDSSPQKPSEIPHLCFKDCKEHPTKPERCCDKAFVWSGGEGTSHMCCNVHCCVPKSSE